MDTAQEQGARATGLALPEMPFDFGDLEPAMSRDAVALHFSRHHADHFDRTCALARGASLDQLRLEELIVAAARAPRLRTLYRHAAEAWNHDCFWKSLRDGGGGRPRGRIGEAIDARYGSYERFVRRFHGAAATLFGNGWLWLTWKDSRIRIVATAAGDTPLARGHTVLLALDLWEHAYYLDHGNRRGAYIRSFLDELANWAHADRVLRGVAAGATKSYT